MFAAVAALFTELLPLVRLCYSQPTHLLFQSSLLLSQAGVQQGDPLGPLLFALTTLPLIQAIQSSAPALRLNGWFLDDGTLVGPAPALAAAWQTIATIAPTLGLTLRIDKCVWWSPLRAPLPAGLPPIPTPHPDGFELLGSAIGSPCFQEAIMGEKR